MRHLWSSSYTNFYYNRNQVSLYLLQIIILHFISFALVRIFFIWRSFVFLIDSNFLSNSIFIYKKKKLLKKYLQGFPMCLFDLLKPNMRNSNKRKMLNLELFPNSLILYLYSKFWRGFEVMKISKCWSLKRTGMSYDERYAYTEIRGKI